MCWPCVCARQPGVLPHTLYAKFLWSVASHEFPKPPHGEPTGTCDKLKKTDALLVVKLSNALQNKQLYNQCTVSLKIELPPFIFNTLPTIHYSLLPPSTFSFPHHLHTPSSLTIHPFISMPPFSPPPSTHSSPHTLLLLSLPPPFAIIHQFISRHPPLSLYYHHHPPHTPSLLSSRPDLPEPLYLLAVPVVVPVDSVLLPLCWIQLLHAAQHQLQLTLIKELQPLEWHHLIEAVQEGLGLLLHATLETPLGHHPEDTERKWQVKSHS